MNRRIGASLIVATLVLTARGETAVDFDVTLARLARVAELYRDTALGFACEETIVTTGFATRRMQLAYILIKGDDGKLRDFRTWRTGATSKHRGEEVDPRDYKIPRYLASAYLWAFVFRSDRQPLHRFQMLGRDTAIDRPALKVQFEPLPPVIRGLNDWAGFAWVDAESSQILKFESYAPPDWKRRNQVVSDLAGAATRSQREEKDAVEIDKIVTEFGFMKNGMRFPSHVEMSTTETSVKFGRRGDPLRERVIDRVVQDYSKFEFFSVRTSEEINKFVSGQGPLDTVP